MAAVGESTGDFAVNTEEDLITKHKKEKKDLQAQIQKLKHTIPKGDKKKKKEVTEQIAKLEADLESRHATEQEQFKSLPKVEGEAEGQSCEVTETVKEAEDSTGGKEFFQEIQTGEKKSKAQKRRDKREAQGRERDARIKDQEVENRQGPRLVELGKLTALLKGRGLALHQIPADGNCMYNAINHQLTVRGKQSSNDELRQKAAEHMRGHRDDFLPFLTHPDTGDMLTEEEFEAYCDKTANTPVWGGQVELRALSEALQVPFEVLQADTQPILVGETGQGAATPITLVYHRHIFRLGEHYNSVLPLTEATDQTEEAEDDTPEDHTVK